MKVRCFLDGAVFLGSLACDLRCVAGWRLMNGSMSPSPRVRCMCGVVVVQEQCRLHGALHRLRVGVCLRVLHAFWGSAEAGVQVLFLLRTVLSRLILSRFVWNLHRHVSSASLLLCMVITMHVTHIILRIHTACMVHASVYKGKQSR